MKNIRPKLALLPAIAALALAGCAGAQTPLGKVDPAAALKHVTGWCENHGASVVEVGAVVERIRARDWIGAARRAAELVGRLAERGEKPPPEILEAIVRGLAAAEASPPK